MIMGEGESGNPEVWQNFDNAVSIENDPSVFASGVALDKRMQMLRELSQVEFAAYELFRKVGERAAQVSGTDIETYTSISEDGDTIAAIVYPPINYDPDPEDSSSREQIVLYESQVIRDGELVSLQPRLEVYSMLTVGVHGLNSDYAKVVYDRTELDALSGRDDDGHATALSRELFAINAPIGAERIQERMETQSEYVAWLDKCVWSLDMGTQFLRPTSIPTNN